MQKYILNEKHHGVITSLLVLVRPYLRQDREVCAPHGHLLGDLPGQADGGVDDEVTVQDEDAEDEDALAGGEDDIESQHDPVGPGVGLCGDQLPDSEGQVGYDGADQEQQQDGVAEHLGELSPSLTVSTSAAVAQLASGLQLTGGPELLQGLIPPPVTS